jgi:hypothetical protein
MDVLAAVDRLEAITQSPVDGEALLDALSDRYDGEDGRLFRVLSNLAHSALINGHLGGGMSVRNSALLELTGLGRGALVEAIGPPMEPEQESVLTRLVEAAQQAPRDQRTIYLFRVQGGTLISGAGFKDVVPDHDVFALEQAGLIQRTGHGEGDEYVLTSRARARYAVAHRTHGTRTSQQEQQVRRLLDDEAFRRHYPTAYARWCDSADKLWSAEGERSFTTIGHECREAMQAFATEALALYAPPGPVEQDAARVKKRLGAVIAMMRPQLGERRRTFLERLGDFEEALLDLIQRQEHGAQKDGEALTWDDARRVVFHTMSVMVELAISFDEASRQQPRG